MLQLNLYLKNDCFFFYIANFIGMILTDKRGRLTPELFENLLLLHMNDW